MTNFDKNLKAIKQTYGDLYKSLSKKTYKIDENISFVEQKNKFVNMHIKAGTKTFPAYGINENKKEISSLVNKLELVNQYVTVIIGIGAGHFIEGLLKKAKDKHNIIIIEPCIQMIAKSLELYDFSEEIKSFKIVFATTETEINYIISLVDQMKVVENYTLITSSYTQHLQNIYEPIILYTSNAVNQIKCNTGTMMGNGKTIAENDINNLPYIIRHRGVNELKDIYKNKPIVLVSTGPSLAKNIHLLKNAQGKVIIVAVAQALRILLAYDIKPDFICTLDFGEVNLEHFKGLMDSKIPLVALNRCYHKILKQWRSPLFISTSSNVEAEENIISFIGKKGSLLQGGSVSHMTLGLALHMGCNPITFIGQDLAYENGLSHNPLADASGKVKIDENGLIEWDVDDPRTLLSKHNMGCVVNTPGYLGGFVQTNYGLLSFITSFENIIKVFPNTNFINATEGGADIKGAKKITLKNVLDKYCKKKISKSHIKPLLSLLDEKQYIKDIEKALDFLKSDIDIMKQIIIDADKGIESIKTARENFDYKKKLNKALADNEKYSTAAHLGAKKISLVAYSIYNESRKINSKDFMQGRTIEDVTSKKSVFNNRCKRNLLILKSAKQASIDLINLYKDAKFLLSRYLISRDSELLNEKDNYEVSFDDVNKYFDKGNFAHPLCDVNISDKAPVHVYLKAVSMRQKAIDKAEKRKDITPILRYNECLIEAQELGRNKKYDKAKIILKEAIKLIPKRHEAKWGLATILHLDGDSKGSIKLYTQLVKRFPENHRFLFELGNVYLCIDIKKGVNIITKAMDMSDDYNHFFLDIGKWYIELKKYNEAIDALNEYIKFYPYNIEAFELLHHSYTMIKDYDKAISTEKKARKIDANFKGYPF